MPAFPSLPQPEVRKKKKKRARRSELPTSPNNTLWGFASIGEAEKELSGASRHMACPAAKDSGDRAQPANTSR